ncbi:Exonuclease SbcC [Burkholderia cenocepacia]|nr:Exonuclease SbcC [Burkholderia cenocepacia]
MFERVAREEVGHVADAEPREHGAAQRFHVVAGHRGAQRERLAVVGRKRPVLQLAGGREAVAHAVVRFELARRARRAGLREIGGRRAQHERERAEPPRHQARIGQRAAADHRVEAALDHVDHPVVEIEIELDVRIALPEFGQHRQQEAVADYRQAHAQLAARALRGRRHGRLRVAEILENALAALVEMPPLVGERHAPRRAVEQAHAERLFQFRDRLADRRRRDAERAAGRDEAQRFGGADERDDAGEVFHLSIESKDVRRRTLAGVLRNFSPLYAELRVVFRGLNPIYRLSL